VYKLIERNVLERHRQEFKISFSCYRAGVFSRYLLEGHIFVLERFAGRLHVLLRIVCMLLQDIHTNIFLHKHT
jgi:hypothetical protein